MTTPGVILEKHFLEKLFKKKKFIFWCMSKSKKKRFFEEYTCKQKKLKQKLVSVVKGKILDIVVDCRLKSKKFWKTF